MTWPENLTDRGFLEGVDQAKLVADDKALTGKKLQIPAPPCLAPDYFEPSQT